jgi:hypothetical protein
MKFLNKLVFLLILMASWSGPLAVASDGTTAGTATGQPSSGTNRSFKALDLGAGTVAVAISKAGVVGYVLPASLPFLFDGTRLTQLHVPGINGYANATSITD